MRWNSFTLLIIIRLANVLNDEACLHLNLNRCAQRQGGVIRLSEAGLTICAETLRLRDLSREQQAQINALLKENSILRAANKVLRES